MGKSDVCALFGFLTTKPNADVGAIHPKALPVTLTTEEECLGLMQANDILLTRLFACTATD